MVSAALVLAIPAQIAQAASDGAGRDGAALPFSTADVGWVLLGAAVLLVLWVSLQLVARRRRREQRSVARQRTDP
jgi:hypothetical protein